MITATLNITGTTPLLMHADTLADPLSPEYKEMRKVSAKRVKTDEDHETMARLEWVAGLYTGTDGAPCIMGRNVMKCLIEGARVTKSGPKIERGLVVTGQDFPLVYEGPRDVGGLFADKRFVSRMTVKVGQARIMRCRPMFKVWGARVGVLIDPKIISVDDLREIAADAGALIGLGDYRKGGGFGRFLVEVI